MHPELFEIPFVHITLRSYGPAMVIGFLLAVAIIRRLSRDITPDQQMITNAALYSLIVGVVGSRVFFVIHNWDQFRGNWLSVFAIWQGGIELLGGVLPAVGVIFFYLVYHKLPIRRYLDILAIGLMLALVPGRIGCFLNGCCWGKPTDLPWGVRFPYGSFAYRSQISPDPARNRAEAYLDLPAGYFGYMDEHGDYYTGLKPWEQLTAEQKEAVRSGPYRCVPVHPTQLYASAAGGVLCFVLYLVWRRSRRAEKAGQLNRPLVRPGSTFALMFVLYGIVRFLLECVRDDNAFEIDSLTVSQLIAIALIVLGVGMIVVFARLRPDKVALARSRQ